MTVLTGKTRGILERLPHFYDPGEAGQLLVQFVDVFGHLLERAETDLYRVLRAHHVETADNEVTRGYLAPLAKRGDLDKILGLYLEVLGGTSQLVKVRPEFTERSFDARRLARALTTAETPLAAYLRGRLRPRTRRLLCWFRVERTAFRAREIHPRFAVEILVGGTPLAAYIRERLAPDTRELLEAFDGRDLDPALRRALARDLDRRVLPDPALYRRLADYFDTVPLPAGTRRLRNGIHRDFLQARPAALRPPEEELAGAEAVPTPPGDDLRRLNRLLIEAVYGSDGRARDWGVRRSRVPALRELREALVRDLNALLEDPALFSPERFPELLDDLDYLRERYGNRVAWLNRVLLESAFPDVVERSYAPYRERLLGLIQVLRRGASTRQGIVDIVAANLGIIGADPEARRARALIRIEEFDPQQQPFFQGDLRFWEEFVVENPNLQPAEAELWVTMLEAPYEIQNVAFRRGGDEVLFTGRMRAGDRLVLQSGGALLNGVPPAAGELRVTRAGDSADPLALPPLPSGRSAWSFRADVVLPGAEAGLERPLPAGRFDVSVGATRGGFDAAVLSGGAPVVRLDVLSYQQTPGVFKVVIPWSIPGFTDKFEQADHPRQQIAGLVEKVKAAGVQAQVAYWQAFREEHEMADQFRGEVSGSLPEEQSAADSLWMAARQGAREAHEVRDSLSLGGRLDMTQWDGPNPFA